MKKILLLLLLFCKILGVFSQSDTTVRLESIIVRAPFHQEATSVTTPHQNLTEKKLETLPVLQLSDALKFMTGIVIRDHGGVGGLKTVSARGFSAQHTALCYDGLVVSDCQTGQIDLGKFSINNIGSMSLFSGGSYNSLTSAREHASANCIHINTKKPSYYASKPIGVKAEMVTGSFGLVNPTIVLESLLVDNEDKKNKKDKKLLKLTTSVLVNYLQSKGDFPFTLSYGQNGDSTSLERRENAKIRSLNAEANLNAFFKKNSHIAFKVYYYNSKRELPGAVIYYNQPSGQILWDQNLFAQMQYFTRGCSNKISYLLRAKVNFAYQHYLDPEYLNAAGELDNSYWQNEYYISNGVRYKPFSFFNISVVNDVFFNDMTSNIRFFVDPSRLTSLTHAQASFKWKRMEGKIALLHTYMHHWTKRGETPENNSHFSPSASFSFRLMKEEDFYINAFYKNIFRAPSFNDLYYREVGNLDLEPENTHQINLGLLYSKSFYCKQMQINLGANGYFNMVDNKIVAIPNHNLFSWSMMNYGKVRIGGAEAQLSYEYHIITDLSLALHGNYTFQYAVDITDPESKTYLHQIPYTPLHSGSASISILYKWINFSYSLIGASKRYTTPQNKEKSSLSPYTDHSIALFKEYPIKVKEYPQQKIKLGFKLEFLNILNTQYEVIRNYPMPGRAFRVGITFEF